MLTWAEARTKLLAAMKVRCWVEEVSWRAMGERSALEKLREAIVTCAWGGDGKGTRRGDVSLDGDVLKGEGGGREGQ